MKKGDLNADNARNENEIFAELSELCRSPGYIHAIAYFCFRDNLIRYSGEQVTEKDTAYQYSSDRLLRAEISTLLGLMVKAEIDTTLPKPEELSRFIERSEFLLHEMHMSLQKPWMIAIRQRANGVTSADPFKNADGLREPIFYSGESAYNFQYEALAVAKYHADDNWLRSNVGFTIEHAFQIARDLGDLQIRKMLELRAIMRPLAPDQWTMVPGFVFSGDELKATCNVDPDAIDAFIHAFCFDAKTANAPFDSLSSFNETNAAPLVELAADSYILLRHYSLLEAIHESPFFWMIRDKNYAPTAAQHRGEFVENFLADRLAKVFGDQHVHRNVDIYRGKDRVAEVDVLVLYGNAAIVVQAKSKRLTIEARKGNDLQLQVDFKNAIQDAHDQATSCAQALIGDGYRFVLASSGEVAIHRKPTSIFPMCVVADHYPALAFQARQFLKASKSDTVHPSIVTDVFFVDVLTEILESPLQLLNYMALRSRFDEKLSVSQEFAALGFHLKHNLWLEDQYDWINLGDDFTSSLDIAMTARRTGVAGAKTPAGILTRFRGSPIGNLLDQIEASATPDLVGLGTILLQMGSEAAKHINAGLIRLVHLAGKDHGHHDFSIPSEPTKSGLTVHVNSLPDDEARERLAAHCRLRKYDSKSNSWYGLLLYPQSGKIRGALALEGTWKHDTTTEDALKGWSRKPMVPISLLSRRSTKIKIGRNDLCLCGSGKKYKKCCLAL